MKFFGILLALSVLVAAASAGFLLGGHSRPIVKKVYYKPSYSGWQGYGGGYSSGHGSGYYSGYPSYKSYSSGWSPSYKSYSSGWSPSYRSYSSGPSYYSGWSPSYKSYGGGYSGYW